MSIFEDVVLTWDDKEYVVPAQDVWGLAKVVFDKIPLSIMGEVMNNPYRLAEGYVAALRYAGVPSKPIYTNSEGGERYDLEEQVLVMVLNPKKRVFIQNLVFSIFQMTMPPEHLKSILAAQGNQQAPKRNKQTPKKKSKSKTQPRKRT